MSKNKRQIKKKEKATWQQKFQYELGRNRELTMKMRQMERGVEETREVVDRLLIRTAMACGEKTGEEYRLSLPEVSIDGYNLIATQGKDRLELVAVRKDAIR